jgi:hypothetical protein
VDTETYPPKVPLVPIESTPSVMLTAVLAATAPDISVITMLEELQGDALAVAAALINVLDGANPTAKKPTGNVKVIVSDAASAPPAVGVKLNVTGTMRLEIRSESAIPNQTPVTAPPVKPEGMLDDGSGS